MSTEAPLVIERSAADDRAVRLVLRGELDSTNVSDLRRAVLPDLDAGHDVEIEVSGLEFIDSVGLGLFVSLHRAAIDHDVEFRVVRPSASVARVMEITRLDDLLTIVS